MARRKWRGWRFNTLKPEQKKLVLAGIPERFWAKTTDPDFHPILFDAPAGKKRITSKDQAAWAQRLRENDNLIQGHLIILGSMFEDAQALQVAFGFVLDRVSTDDPPMVIDLAKVPRRSDADWWDSVGAANLILMHNITADATADRVQTARDLIVGNQETTRIVVVAGMDPVKYAFEVLRVVPDVAFYTDGRTKKVSH